MKKYVWEEILKFDGWSEYDRFENWILKQVAEKAAIQVAIDRPYSGMLEEKWFKNNDTGEIWRLVRPEPPFAGVFKPVRDHH